MNVREMGRGGEGETDQCAFIYICEIVKERTNLIVWFFFLLQKESWVRQLSCNLSAGEVEMGWESLEFSCPPALHNHLISEPRVSSYSASTSKVDSTECRTVETFE